MATLKIRNSSNTGWIDAVTALGVKVRNQSNTGWIDKTGSLAGFSVRNATNTGWITFAGGISYSITPSSTSVNEGTTVTYTINTSGFGTGTLYWTNSGTSAGSDFSDGLNSGTISITANTGTLTRTTTNDLTTEGSETLIINLRTGGVAGPIVSTASTVTITDSSTAPAFPSSMTMVRNNLEFLYSGTKTTTANTAYVELIMTLDTTNFFNLATGADDHIVFALDTAGDSSVFALDGTRDHCGQIVRHGVPLWDVARGFIIKRNGVLAAEHWYAGKPAGTPGFGLFEFGVAFNPLSIPVFTVRIRAGYRVGTYGEQMEIDIFNGTSTASPLLTGGAVPWGWDWTGQHKHAFAAIAAGFQDPNITGCVESSALGSAYGATIGISNYSFNVYNA